MNWILILYVSGHSVGYPIDMPSKEICQVAAKNMDDKTVNLWTLCLNKSTGEVWKNVE